MIQFVTSPEEIKLLKQIKLYLAGDNWQEDVIEWLYRDSESKHFDYLCNVIVFNPHRRRDDEKQIIWEYNKLKESDIIAFWISAGNNVLYELGKWGYSSNKPIVVGMDEGYPGKTDIEIQTKLARPDVKIVYNLKDLYYNLLQEIKKINK